MKLFHKVVKNLKYVQLFLELRYCDPKTGKAARVAKWNL